MVIEAEWENRQRSRIRANRVSAVFGAIFVGLIVTPAAALAMWLASGPWAWVLCGAFAMLLGTPCMILTIRNSEARERRTDKDLRSLTDDLAAAVSLAQSEAAKSDGRALRQRSQSRIANALDMADGESEAIDVIGRALSHIMPEHTSELLLADHSHAHLVRMTRVGPDAEQPGCSVDSPDRCPAALRAQPQIFASSADFDACPKLRNHVGDPVSAVCVPVSIMGRAVGVIHSNGPVEHVVGEVEVDGLNSLAKMAGSRMGMLRVVADTQLQAATDSLTGLLNRRSFEQKVGELREVRMPLAIAMADLDHFKSVNDTYGHETGDRALRLFSRVLRESLRSDDLVCRYGGEEFALAFPGCLPVDAGRILDALRNRLDAAVTVNGLPAFTCSFGVTELRIHEDLPSCLRRADNALFAAKRSGRDRVVVDGREMSELVGDCEDEFLTAAPAEID